VMDAVYAGCYCGNRECSMRCSAKTISGKRCKRDIKVQIKSGEWVCRQHGHNKAQPPAYQMYGCHQEVKK
jgi:hypothetical protein